MIIKVPTYISPNLKKNWELGLYPKMVLTVKNKSIVHKENKNKK